METRLQYKKKTVSKKTSSTDDTVIQPTTINAESMATNTTGTSPGDLVLQPQVEERPLSAGTTWSIPTTDEPETSHAPFTTRATSNPTPPPADQPTTLSEDIAQLVRVLRYCFDLQGSTAAAVSAMTAKAAATTAASTTKPGIPVPNFRTEEYLRTFGGEPDEDPEAFINELEAYFSEVGNLNDRLQVLVAHRQLRGIAARQNKPYGPTDTCVAHLWQRLRASFGTEDNYSELLAKFTSSHFSYRDALDVYVSKQQRLHRRLFPGGSKN